MPKKNGRPTTQPYWDEMIRRYNRSGQTQAEFCQANGIKLATLRKRISKCRQNDGKVHVKPLNRESGEPAFIVSIPGVPQFFISETHIEELRETLIGLSVNHSMDEVSQLMARISAAKARLDQIKLVKYS